jgi:tetratricopeptide (TPR) repeat protein
MRIAMLLLLLAVPALAGGADDDAKAVEAARKAVQANPADIDAWLKMADAHVAMGSPEDACGDLEEGIAKNKDEVRLWLKLGDVNMKVAEKMQKDNPTDGTTIMNYYLDAERCYGEAAKRDPKSAAAIYGKANADYWSGREGGKEDAKRLLADCLALDKNFGKAYALQAYMLYLDGSELAKQGKHADAKPKFQAAEEAYATALKLGDTEPFDMVRYGHTLLAQERLDEAKQAYIAALKASPKVELPIVSGLYYVANRGEARPSWGNPKLKTILAEAVKEAPDSPVAWYYYGYTQTVGSDWKDALQSYGKALELDPKNATYTYEVGYMQEKLGDEAKALDCYRKALALYPDHPQATERFYGIIIAKSGDMDRAEKLFEELIKLSPNTTYVLNDYALLLRNWAEATKTATQASPSADVKRRLKRSGEVYEMAAAIAADVPQIQSDTGLLFEYYPCNFDAAKAKRYFTRALQLSDYAYRDAFDGLDRLCRRTGDWETLAEYAEAVVGSMERGNQAMAPVNSGAVEKLPNESPGLKARAQAALDLAQQKLKKS